MRQNYGGDKKRREEAKRKWQEEKRSKKLAKKSDPAEASPPMQTPGSRTSDPSIPTPDPTC